MSPKPDGTAWRPPQGRGAAVVTFFLHHFSRTLLKDGVGLDNLGPAPAPAMPITLPIPVSLLLFLLDGDILSGPGERGGDPSPPPQQWVPHSGHVLPTETPLRRYQPAKPPPHPTEMLTRPLTLP